MRHFTSTVGVTLASALAVTTLHAQSPVSPKPPTGKPSPGESAVTIGSHGGSVCSSKLLSHDVVNANGEAKGTIEELLLDPRGERVLFALVSCEDHDGLFAVPVRELRITSGEDEDELVVGWTPTEAQLESLPKIAEDDWSEATSVTFANTVRSHYDASPVGAVDRTDVLPSKIVRVSELLGHELKDAAGEDAGELKSLMIDRSTGRVAFAIVETEGGLLGSGDDVGVPLGVLEHHAATEDEEAQCRLTISAEKLEGAPKFDPESETWNESSYRSRLDRYFGDSSAEGETKRGDRHDGRRKGGSDGEDG